MNESGREGLALPAACRLTNLTAMKAIQDLVQASRLATLLCLVAALTILPLPISGQTRRVVTRKQPSAGPATKTIQATTLPGTGRQQRVQLVRSDKSRAMSHAFSSGKLPDPLRMPVGNVDTQAAALAKSVSAGDESSTAALHAAVLAAGFGVRDEDESVMQTTERGQGLAFDTWEIATASKLYGDGYGVTLKHMGDSFARGIPETRDVPVAAELLQGIRTGAASEHPSVRFWARFIVEMGRNSTPSYDMLRQNDVAKIRLDAVQTFFILKRFLGDLAASARQTEVAHVTDRVADVSRVSFVPARMSVVSPFAKRPNRTPAPCAVEGWDGVILDYNALASTTLFGTLADRMGGRFDKYGKAAGIANIVSAILKVIASYALVTTEITIDGHPLVRTPNLEPGARQILTAKLETDPSKWQKINCFRPALNLIGLDFNLPDAGPIADVQVVWKQLEGGDDRGWIGTIQDFRAIMNGEPTWGGRIVFLEPLPGPNNSTDNQRTDGNGISRMPVVGVPQAKDLSKEKLVKVNKVAGVKLGIQLKSMRVSNPKTLVSTLGDLAGNVISFLTGDMGGGIVGTGAETLYRSNWFSSQPFYFVVQDWEPCAGLWQGTMKTTTIRESNTVETGGPGTDYVIKNISSYKFDATIKFEGTKAYATIEVEETITNDQKSGYGTIYLQQKRTANYSGEVRAEATSSGGQYDVGFEMPRFWGTYQSSGSCSRPAPFKCEQPKSISTPWEFNDGRYLSHMRGDLDPNKPNEVNDTKTRGEPGSLQHTVTVNLKRCQ